MENKKTTPKIAIILLNYNNYEDTFACVESLQRVRYPNVDIIIVDNKSTNDSLEKLYELKSENIKIVDSGKNGGFAFGNNMGMKIAREENSDYVLLLNNDTIVTENFLDELLKCFSYEEDVGIATGRIMYNSEKDKVWYAGGKIDWNNLRAIHRGINGTVYSTKGMENVGFASGCCMMISKECLRKVGGLPEDYFMYYEDLDYCVKATEAGYKIIYNPESVIYHCVSSSGGGEDSPFVIEWTNRSRRKLYHKYKRYIKKLHRPVVCAKCEIRSIMKIVTNRKGFIKAMQAYIKSYQTV